MPSGVGDKGGILKNHFLPSNPIAAGEKTTVLKSENKIESFSGLASVGEKIKVLTVDNTSRIISASKPNYILYCYSSYGPDVNGREWQKVTIATGIDETKTFPKIYIDPNNRPHVFWSVHGETKIYHKFVNNSDVWKLETISVPDGYKVWSTNQHGFDVLISSDGTIHLFQYIYETISEGVYRQHLIYSKRTDQWTAPAIIFSQPEGVGFLNYPHVSIDYDKNGNIHGMTKNLSFSNYDVAYMWYSGGTWNTYIPNPITPVHVSYYDFTISKSSDTMRRTSFYLWHAEGFDENTWWYRLMFAHGWAGGTWYRDGIDTADYIHPWDLERMNMTYNWVATTRFTHGSALGGIYLTQYGTDTNIITHYSGFSPEAIITDTSHKNDVISLKKGPGDLLHYSCRISTNVYHNYIDTGTLEFHYSRVHDLSLHQHYDVDSKNLPHFVIISTQPA